jgi:hypothetical protein
MASKVVSVTPISSKNQQKLKYMPSTTQKINKNSKKNMIGNPFDELENMTTELS